MHHVTPSFRLIDMPSMKSMAIQQQSALAICYLFPVRLAAAAMAHLNPTSQLRCSWRSMYGRLWQPRGVL